MADWIAGSRARRAALLTSLALTAGLLGAATSASAGPAAGAPWKIETVAGGDGGPGPALGIDIGSPCAVSFAAGRLYVGNNEGADPILVRSIRTRHRDRGAVRVRLRGRRLRGPRDLPVTRYAGPSRSHLLPAMSVNTTTRP
jgi:hypothetical protein